MGALLQGSYLVIPVGKEGLEDGEGDASKHTLNVEGVVHK